MKVKNEKQTLIQSFNLSLTGLSINPVIQLKDEIVIRCDINPISIEGSVDD